MWLIGWCIKDVVLDPVFHKVLNIQKSTLTSPYVGPKLHLEVTSH